MLSKSRLNVCQLYKLMADNSRRLCCRRTYESGKAIYDVDTLEDGTTTYMINCKAANREDAVKYFEFIEHNIPAVVYDATKWMERYVSFWK